MRGFYRIVFVMYVSFFINMDAQYDPMHDFQVPYSLSEQIHVGLNNVTEALRDQDCRVAMQEIYAQLLQLDQLSASVANSHSFHGIYRDDRQTLQALIDKIDALLLILESEDSVEPNSENIEKSRQLIQSIKTNIDR